ncbi:hypothetical protein FA95DRAFT_1038164 [Auriscalpium vulgare]|uniref:Uncharacterized protein n=1 Tax=Auriscalpium vulgare TaxID=40419 RepID=A0ACB8RWH2_9AGAM|nr:hypothetical protein FA95DRAFT_1038164 [Auriscalpium vulgare]
MKGERRDVTLAHYVDILPGNLGAVRLDVDATAVDGLAEIRCCVWPVSAGGACGCRVAQSQRCLGAAGGAGVTLQETRGRKWRIGVVPNVRMPMSARQIA